MNKSFFAMVAIFSFSVVTLAADPALSVSGIESHESERDTRLDLGASFTLPVNAVPHLGLWNILGSSMLVRVKGIKWQDNFQHYEFEVGYVFLKGNEREHYFTLAYGGYNENLSRGGISGLVSWGGKSYNVSAKYYGAKYGVRYGIFFAEGGLAYQTGSDVPTSPDAFHDNRVSPIKFLANMGISVLL